MAYSKFKLGQVLDDFNITLIEGADLFPNVLPAEPSELLKAVLKRGIPLGEAISTEKARSEFVLAPLLSEVHERMAGHISLFSGVEFTVDAARGLNGECPVVPGERGLIRVVRDDVRADVDPEELAVQAGHQHLIARDIRVIALRLGTARPRQVRHQRS